MADPTALLTAIAAAQKERPSLIILDLGLPVGDGFVVLDRLQSIDALSSIPIIVLSARDPQSNEERALKAGASTVFISVWPVLKSLPQMGTSRSRDSSSIAGMSTVKFGAPFAKGTPSISEA